MGEMEEHQKLRKKRAIRVAITELLMFFSVIILVVILTLIVLGYNFNINKIGTEETVIERSGLLQVTSIPTGATVSLDGDEIFSRTNLSRTLSAGKHKIVLSRDGYDSWEKEITVTEGLLYRLGYPQLFLKKRTREAISTIPVAELVEDEEKKESKGELDVIMDSVAFKEDAVVGLGEYLGENYLIVVEKNIEDEVEKREMTIYSGSFSTLGVGVNELDSVDGVSDLKNEAENGEREGPVLEDDIDLLKPEFELEIKKLIKSGLAKKIYTCDVPFEVKRVAIKGKGELIISEGANEDLIYDIESGRAETYLKDSGEGWLNDFLKYKIADGKLEVWDFDNTNRRLLVSENVANERVLEDGTVENKIRLSKNNRYLFYYRLMIEEEFNEETNEIVKVEKEVLVREKVS